MTIEVRLFATLAEFLPPRSYSGTATLDVPEGARVSDVVAVLGIPPALPCIVLVNGQDAETDWSLVPGDVVSMFPPLAGG